jgi:hypothetical protein
MNFNVSSNPGDADDAELPLEDVELLFTGWLLFVGCFVVGDGDGVGSRPVPP